jgi:cytosine/adenosine deaminase-related metal-dependent hydrolase
MRTIGKLSTGISINNVADINTDKDRQILFRGATILSMDPNVGDLRSGDVLIHGKKIEAVAKDLSSATSNDNVLVIDAAGYVLTPGLQDVHRHCWYGQLRRTMPDTSDVGEYFSLFYNKLAPLFSLEDIYVGTLISALSSIDAGITNIHDVLTNAYTAAHGDAAIEALCDAGIRGTHVQFGSLTGQGAEQWPRDLRRVKEKFFSSQDQLQSLRLGVLGSGYLVSEDVVITPKKIEFARDLGIAITADAVVLKMASDNIEALGRAGLLGPDILLTHCLELSDEAWRMIADNGVGVALTTTSDARFGSLNAISPMQKCLDLRLRAVGIGIDTEVNSRADLFAQIDATLVLQRALMFNRRYVDNRSDCEGMSLKDIFSWATIGGARATGDDHRVGSITPGKEADLLAFNVSNINNLPVNDPYGAVVSASSVRDLELVMIAGVIRKWDGELLDVDLEALRLRAETSRDRLIAGEHLWN